MLPQCEAFQIPPRQPGSHVLTLSGHTTHTVTGRDPLSLLAAPYHLFRATKLQLLKLITMLRSMPYATQLTEADALPPLPMLLMDVLCRGTDGARDLETVNHLGEDMGGLIQAMANPTKDGRRLAVWRILHRLAKRLEMKDLVTASRAAERRRQINDSSQKSPSEVSARTIQRAALSFIRIKRAMNKKDRLSSL